MEMLFSCPRCTGHFHEALKRLKQALGLFIPSYINRTNSFPRGSQEAETSCGPLHPLLYESNKFISRRLSKGRNKLWASSSPFILVEHIHFQEALKRLKQALGLFITSYISRTNSFPGGSQEAETSFGPFHPLLYSSNKFISRKLSRRLT